jgi:hypothetical protein
MKPIDFLEQAVQPTTTTSDATTTAATSDQQAKLKAAQQQQAMSQARAIQASQKLNLQQLKQLLPNIDVAKLTAAIKANASGRMNNIHLMSMGIAFQDLLKSDPNNTIKVMNLLKKAQTTTPVVTANPVQGAQSAIGEGIWDTAKAISNAPFQAVQKAKDIYHGAQEIGSGIKGAYQGIKQGAGAAIQGAQTGYQASKITHLNQEISNNLFKMIKNSITPTISKYAASFSATQDQGTNQPPTNEALDQQTNQEAVIQAASKDIYNRVLKALKIYNPNVEIRLADKIDKEFKIPTTAATLKNLNELLINGKFFDSIKKAVEKRDFVDLQKTLLSLVSSINALRAMPGGKEDISSYLNFIEPDNKPDNKPNNKNKPNDNPTISFGNDKRLIIDPKDPFYPKIIAAIRAQQQRDQQ